MAINNNKHVNVIKLIKMDVRGDTEDVRLIVCISHRVFIISRKVCIKTRKLFENLS